MQKATLKYIAEYEAKEDPAGANGILSSSSAIQGAVGILGFLICLFVSPHATKIFSLPAYMKSEALWAVCLLGAGVAISFSISPWLNSVAAQERYDLLSLAKILGKFFRAGLIVALLHAKAPSLISIVAATIAGNIFERLICICFIKKISPHLKLDIRNVSAHYVKVLLKFSFFDFFHTLSNLLYSQGALFLAAHLISLGAVASLGIISNINSLISMVMSQFAQMLVPMTSRLHAQGEIRKLRSLILRGTTVTVFSGGIVMAGLVPWMDSLLNLWIGNFYTWLAGPAIVLISATYLLNSLTCIHNSLGGIGRVAIDGISSTMTTALGLAVGTLLVVVFDLDLMGLVIGLLFARVIRFGFISWYGTRVFEYSIVGFLWDGYFRAYILVLIISLAGILTDFTLKSWLLLIAAGGLSASLYILAGTFWIIDPVDRMRFIASIQDAIAYVKKKPQRRTVG
jgi:membrane protein EpsK